MRIDRRQSAIWMLVVLFVTALLNRSYCVEQTVGFALNEPHIIEVAPMAFPADGQPHSLRLKGTRFSTETRVLIDGLEIRGVALLSPEILTIPALFNSTSAHIVEVRDVSSAVSDTLPTPIFAIKPGEFLVYQVPNITKGGPRNARIIGLKGSFEAGASVYFDPVGQSCSTGLPTEKVDFLGDDSLQVPFPPGVPTEQLGVWVQNPAGTSLCMRHVLAESNSKTRSTADFELQPLRMAYDLVQHSTSEAGIDIRYVGRIELPISQAYTLQVTLLDGIHDLPYRIDRIRIHANASLASGQWASVTFPFSAPDLPGEYDVHAQIVEGTGASAKLIEDASSFSGNAHHIIVAPSAANCSVPNPCTLPSCNTTQKIQTCLDAGGTVTLARGRTYTIVPNGPGNPGLVISQSNTVFMTDSTGGTCSGSTCATLMADVSLQNPILTRNNGVNGYTIKDLIFDGNRLARINNGLCANANLRDPASNIVLKRSGTNDNNNFHILNITSQNTLCGSALNVQGNNFEIVGSNFYNNGYEKRVTGCNHTTECPNTDANPFSDGITLGQCFRTNSALKIQNNLIINATDVGIANGGTGSASNTGCSINNNTIMQEDYSNQVGLRSFSGIGIGSVGTGNGQYKNAVYTGNTINSVSDGKLDFGLRVGNHAYVNSMTMDGSFTSNTLIHANVNLEVDGACTNSGTLSVANNQMKNPDVNHPFSQRFNITECNARRGNFSTSHCNGASITGNTCPDGTDCTQHWWFHHNFGGARSCGDISPQSCSTGSTCP